jgi:hypothetical protein
MRAHDFSFLFFAAIPALRQINGTRLPPDECCPPVAAGDTARGLA